MRRRPSSVTVTVPARLHLGFLDLNGGLGRRFGSIGLAINGMATRITAMRADELQTEGPDSARAFRYTDQMQDRLGRVGCHRVIVHQSIPSHSGLGSGTQLALAVAAAIRALHGLPLAVREDAILLGRGARSGVGIGLFEGGGFLVDGGRRSPNTDAQPAPIISRIEFPPSWRVIVVLDPTHTGVHGEAEIAAFTKLPPFAPQLCGEICRSVLMQVLPALAETDFIMFTNGIERIQSLLGTYFAPLQGGRPFTSAAVENTVQLLRREGGRGIGQSSWGPTGFVFAASQAEAERLLRIARSGGHSLNIRICSGLNRGAQVVTEMLANASTHF